MIFNSKYELISDFHNASSGNARWGFAKNIDTGKEYFIKEFLSPKYPMPDTAGSKKVLQKRKEKCLLFEERQKKLINSISSKTSTGGNLITTIDFFRDSSKYYKISEKITIDNISIDEISCLTLDKKLFLLKTIAHSLRILHNLNILHADLKPDNILIKKTDSDIYTTKLIDFDDSFFVDDIPKSIDDVVGTMLYYSPEIANAIDKEDTSKLCLKSDIYTLGLIYCQYLTGDLPHYNNEKYDYPWEYSLLSGNNINIDDKDIPIETKDIINKMLLSNPNERIDINTLHSELKKIKSTKIDKKTPSDIISYIKSPKKTTLIKTVTETTTKEESGLLKGSLLKNKTNKKDSKGITKLKGTLGRKYGE